MPTWLADVPGQGGERLPGVGIILRGGRVVCLSGVVSASSRRGDDHGDGRGSGLRAAGRDSRAAGGVPRLAGPGAGPVAGVGALLFQAVEGVPGRDRRGGGGQRPGRGQGDRVHGGLGAGPQHVVGEGDGDVAAGVPAVRARDRADGGPAGGSGSRGRVVADVVAAPGPEGGGDRAAAGRLRPGHGGGPAGLRGPVAAGPARPAGCRGRRAAARRHRLAGRRDRGHAARAAGPSGSRCRPRPGRRSPPGWRTAGRSASRGRCS